MDREISKQQQIEQLIRTSAQSRAVLTAEVRSIKAKLDVPGRLRSSLKVNPLNWMLSSAASGLAASLLFRRKPAKADRAKAGKKHSHPIRFFALLLTIVRPLAKVWLTGRVKHHLAGGASRLVSANRRRSDRSLQ